MARIRTIKPDFFTSEDIVGISPLARLLYIATWLEADREGRLVWRPKTLKLRYLPGDQCDIEMLADELVSAGLVMTYEINGQTFAEIPTFAKHQVINNRESASTITARVTDATTTREQRVTDATTTREQRVTDATTTREARVTDATTTPLMGKEGKGKEGNDVVDDTAVSSIVGKAADPCPHHEIIDLYHRTLPMGRQVRVWTEARRAKLRARWREDSKRQSLEWWGRLFAYIAKSEFLTGKVCAKDRKPFEIDLEWIITPANLVKIIEGKYDEDSGS